MRPATTTRSRDALLLLFYDLQRTIITTTYAPDKNIIRKYACDVLMLYYEHYNISYRMYHVNRRGTPRPISDACEIYSYGVIKRIVSGMVYVLGVCTEVRNCFFFPVEKYIDSVCYKSSSL